MTKFNFFFISILFSFILVNATFSQGFNSIHTPDGINVIAVGDSGRIFRSTNSGNSWASYVINSTVDYKCVHSFNNDVWIAGSNGNVYKTAKTNAPLLNYNVGISSPLNSVFFIDGNTGFVCGDNGVIYKSINGGVNWTSSSSGVSSVKLNSINFRNSSEGIAVGNNGAIYLTNNGGSTWGQHTSGLLTNLLKARYFSNGSIVIVGEYGTLYMKHTTPLWMGVDMKIQTDIRGVTGTSWDNAHVCGGGGFIRNDIGDDKYLNFELNPMMANLVDIFYYDVNNGFAVSSLNKAIIRTTNGGQSWELPAGTNVNFNWVQKISVGSSSRGNNLCQHSKNRDAMFVALDNEVFVSYDRAENWSLIANIPIGSFPHSFFVNPIDTNVWLAAMNGSPDRVIRTTDYGQTWTTILSIAFSNYGMPLQEDQNNPMNYYYTPDGGKFYKSTDMGATFSDISDNFPFRSPDDIVVMYDSSEVMYVSDGVTGSGLADIFKTTNCGFNWTKVHTVSSGSEIPSICNSRLDRSIGYATSWSADEIYKTTNFGDNWSVVVSTGSSGWASDICHEDPTLVLTGSYGAKTFLSTNSGANFTTINIGPGSTTGAGQIFPERGYVLDMRTKAVWKLYITYDVITSSHELIVSTKIPTSLKLYQNYPNPFNPTTKIKFDVPDAGNVRLKVFNQLGKKVYTIVSGYKNAGTYEVEFNASTLSSGIYYYKLVARENILTKKMLLIK